MKSLPNIITLLRLPFTILFFVFFTAGSEGEDRGTTTLIALICLVIAGLTDAADGYLARLLDAETNFGRIVDPLLDKILIVGGFIILQAEVGYLRPWMLIVILARELLVTALRAQVEKSGSHFGALKWGKVKMIVQWIALVVVVSYEGYARWGHPDVSRVIPTISVWIATIITAISAISYIVEARQVFGAGWSRND